jgi:hypothetical protein
MKNKIVGLNNRRKVASKQTKTNIERIHKVLATGKVIVKVDFEYLYLADVNEDEKGEDILTLESDGTQYNGYITFTKDAIENGVIDRNSITMKADDGQEYLLDFFTTEAISL